MGVERALQAQEGLAGWLLGKGPGGSPGARLGGSSDGGSRDRGGARAKSPGPLLPSLKGSR